MMFLIPILKRIFPNYNRTFDHPPLLCLKKARTRIQKAILLLQINWESQGLGFGASKVGALNFLTESWLWVLGPSLIIVVSIVYSNVG
jgi:hypothetical protein